MNLPKRNLIVVLFCLFTIKRSEAFSKEVDSFDLNIANNETHSDGLVYIDRQNSSSPIILAEPDTLPKLKEVNITVRLNLLLNYDLSFVWRIDPINNRKFQESQNVAIIAKKTSSVQITVRTKNTDIPTLNDASYTFFLVKIIDPINETETTPIYISNSSSVVLRILPSNYPFGYFQYSDTIPLNLTIPRFVNPHKKNEKQK